MGIKLLVNGVHYYKVRSGLSEHQWEESIGGVQTEFIQLMTPLPIVFLEECEQPATFSIWQTAGGGVAFLEFVTQEGGRWRVFNHPFALAPWGFVE